MSASTSSTTWDLSHSALSNVINPKRRGQSYSGSGLKRTRQSNDTPFPRRSSSLDSSGQEDVVPREHAQRTVRRKKSSLDLRDIFLNGGVFPATS